MANDDFLQRMNRTYFEGKLTDDVIERLSALPVEREDARQFVERSFVLMHKLGLPAADVSPFQADLLGSIVARLLPGTWGGRVPPITVAGRHRALDQLVLRRCGPRGRMLDIACGFPPFTSVDSADALPGWDILGVDRSLPEYLLEDGLGNYASFDANGAVQYFQPSVPTKENWQALLGDYEGSRRRLETLFRRLREGGTAPEGASLLHNPITQYEREHLHFIRADLDDLSVAPANVVRCFNMLMYFDPDFRARALLHISDLLVDGGLLICGVDWALSIECRCSTYRKQGGTLVPQEFAFTLDNVMPIGIAPWYTLQSDEVEANLLASFGRVLRDDQGFLDAFTTCADGLRQELTLCPRGANGYVGDVPEDIAPLDLWQRASDYAIRLDATLGERAVAALTEAGYSARLNEVGHVAVRV